MSHALLSTRFGCFYSRASKLHLHGWKHCYDRTHDSMRYRFTNSHSVRCRRECQRVPSLHVFQSHTTGEVCGDTGLQRRHLSVRKHSVGIQEQSLERDGNSVVRTSCYEFTVGLSRMSSLSRAEQYVYHQRVGRVKPQRGTLHSHTRHDVHACDFDGTALSTLLVY